MPYLASTDWSRVYLHLSRLAFHTQHLLADGRVKNSSSPSRTIRGKTRLPFNG
ncbi:MAG: hypothetical protein U0361_04675 [Nitrospiraceae bacterium]